MLGKALVWKVIKLQAFILPFLYVLHFRVTELMGEVSLSKACQLIKKEEIRQWEHHLSVAPNKNGSRPCSLAAANIIKKDSSYYMTATLYVRTILCVEFRQKQSKRKRKHNVIGFLYLTTNLQEIWGTEEYVKWHQGNAAGKIQTVETPRDEQHGFFNK